MTNTTSTRYTDGTFAPARRALADVRAWTYDARTDSSHSMAVRCPALRGATRRDLTNTGSTATAWICAWCVEMPCESEAEPDMCPKAMSAVCEGCDTHLPAKKFPTVRIVGVGQVRDDRVCRKCRKAGVRPTRALFIEWLGDRFGFGGADRDDDLLPRTNLRPSTIAA